MDVSERPITFTSRTLALLKKTCAQIDKEAVALVYAVKTFHQYLYGLPFKLYTDHKSLSRYFKENTRNPEITSD